MAELAVGGEAMKMELGEEQQRWVVWTEESEQKEWYSLLQDGQEVDLSVRVMGSLQDPQVRVCRFFMKWLDTVVWMRQDESDNAL